MPARSSTPTSRRPISVRPAILSDDASIRSAVGGSLIWASPLGPLRADFAYVLTKEDYDETQWFRFSGGTRF